MPEDTQSQSSESYRPIKDEEDKEEKEEMETKYITTKEDPTEQKEKYIALEAEVEKTWWDNQTNRTCVAGLISIAFIALIAALVFLLPCTDEEEMTTMNPNISGYVTEIMYEEQTQ